SLSGYSQTSITFSLVHQPCNNDGILAAHVTNAGAVLPLTFSWRIGSQTITRIVNSADDTLYNYSGAYAYVSAFNANPPGGGGQYSGYYAGSPPFTFNDTITPAVCPALATAKATVTGGTAPFQYQWLDVNNNVVSTSNPASLSPGSFQLVITDAAGCVFGTGPSNVSGTTNQPIYVPNNSPVTFTLGSTPANCTNGTATVTNPAGGIAPYSYQWNNGASTTTITGLSAGEYRVTVYDSQGCYLEKAIGVQQSVTIGGNTTITNATCLQNDGSVIAFGSGGQSPYTYSWNNDQQTQSAVGLTAGYYSVTVRDANNCTGMKTANVTAATPVTATFATTPTQCTTPTGTATLNIVGGTAPYTVNWNSFPAQSGITATGLKQGNYSFHITDSSGCVRTGIVTVPPVSIITASIIKTDASCQQNNGTAGVLLLSGANPYTYIWNTGATTSSISSVTAGHYTCTISDNLGCTLTKTVIVNASSPVNIGLNSQVATCIFNSDGSITANATGGTNPYSFHWSDGQTTATATGLKAGHYTVYVEDAAGCTKSVWTDLTYDGSNNTCYCTLSGKVYEDLNQDCNLDNGEPGINNIMIHTSGMGYTYTNSAGIYSVKVPTGNYTLSESVQSYYPLAPCQSNAIAASTTASAGCVITNNFANIVNPIHDVRVITTKINEVVPGFTHQQRVVVENNGTITEPGIQMGYEHDGQLGFSGVVPNLFTQQDAGNFPNWYSITSGFPSLSPNAIQTFTVNYLVPVNIPLGTSIWFKDTVANATPISNWLTDYTPWNNVHQYQKIVVGSFDPNDKEVSPTGNGTQGFISTDDSVLNYTIHFQNTGTFPAQRVVVIDTLDSDLDFTSLVPGYSSHAYVAHLSENGVITFTFDNINLPDSFSQPISSIGMVMYTIKQKVALAGGTEMKSPAAIYFDFNAPVITNTPLNTIDFATAIKSPKTNVLDFNLFPNPSSGNVSLAINAMEANRNAYIRIYNLIGETIYSRNVSLESGLNRTQIELGGLSNGFYFVEVVSGGTSQAQKLSILH
ncbi:MAG: T9SS type A sorting domain-containing protein, partial [Bacteroidetes bacterium]|nr:T9SS type A sorting domain-containing protein [Bacteroidota bacterium]